MARELEVSTPGEPALSRHLRLPSRRRYNATVAVLILGMLPGMLIPVVGGLVSLTCFAVAGVFGVRMMLATRAWGTTFMDAESHLKAHELDEGEAIFRRLPRGLSALPIFKAICVHYLAVLARLRSDLAGARAAVLSLQASGWLEARTGTLAFLSPDAYGEAALVHALLGDVDRAETELAEARGRLSAVRQALLALPSAVVRARRGEWEACIDAIEHERERARGQLRPHDMRALAVVEAYAMTRAATPGYRDLARGRRPEHALADARPARPHEFDYLGHSWPELRAFVTSNFAAA